MCAKVVMREIEIECEGHDTAIAKVLEVLDHTYGLFVWPCGSALAKYVCRNPTLFHRQKVIELGAGVGLPGIVAAKCGSDQVILSDNHSNVIKNGVETIQLNTDIEEHRVCWSKLEWGSFDDNWYNLPMVTVGLAADCLYDSRQFDNFFASLSYLFQHKGLQFVYMTYQNRDANHRLRNFCTEWCLSVREVGLDDFLSIEEQLDLHADVSLLIITQDQ